MTSWANLVGRRAQELSGDVEQSVALQRAFYQVTKEWSEYDANSEVPIASGITMDGIPVEISTKSLIESKYNRLRFIAQPGRPGVSLANDLPFVRQRALEFASAYGGVGAASFVAAAMDCYPCDYRQTITGNFFLWLGLDFRGHKPPLVKLYLNPWASLPELQGAPVIDRLVRISGFESAIPALQGLLACSAKPVIHIIGLNLDSDGVASLKLYFVLSNASVPTLLEIADVFSDSGGFSNALRCATTYCTKKVGQVHGSLIWDRGTKSPYFRANLFCPHWFSSDTDVLLAATALLGGRKAWAELADDPMSAKRWYTFLGIDDAGVILYSRV